MDKITPSLIMDAVLGLILLWKLLQGWSQGMIKRLGGLASALLGILGGRIVRDKFAAQVSTALLLPRVTKVLEHARESIGVSDLLDNLSEILNNTRLPAFAKLDVAEDLMSRAGEAIDSAVGSAAEIVSQRLSEWLVFGVAALVIYILLKLIFNGVLDPVISRLPIVKWLNKLLGLVVGLISGIVVVGLVLWLVYHLMPAFTESGHILSEEAITGSWLASKFFARFPALFQ